MMNSHSVKKTLSFLMALLLCPLAHADESVIRPEKILGVVTADWNDDGHFDRAVLVESATESDQADVLIYLSESFEKMRLAVNKKNIAWRGALWGTLPAIETTGQQSLVIASANDSIGRNRWNQKITLVYRNNAFLVAGYTHSERDTLDPAFESDCDVNFLTGKGLKKGKPFTLDAKPIALTEWSDANVPSACQ